MCGIVGIIKYTEEGLPYEAVAPTRMLAKNLIKESISRGKDASGCCVVNDKKTTVFKQHVPGNNFINITETSEALTRINTQDNFRCFIGHVRAETQGTRQDNKNNHPIICGRTIGVHNGIINNDYELFGQIDPIVKRIAEVDSEIIFALINMYTNGEDKKSLKEAIKLSTERILGGYACATISANNTKEVGLFRNYYPIVIVDFFKLSMLVFASTETIIKRATNGLGIYNIKEASIKLDIPENSGVVVNMDNGNFDKFNLPARKLAYNGSIATRNWSCPAVKYCFEDCSKCYSSNWYGG